MFGQWMGDNKIVLNSESEEDKMFQEWIERYEKMKKEKDIRTIGFRRSNKGRTSNVYMIRECDNCHAILEFPSNQVSCENSRRFYREYIICPNCENKVIVLEVEIK